MDIAASSSTNPAVTAPLPVSSASVRHQSAAGSPLVGKMRGINGNSLLARRYREVAVALADDCGGADKLSEPTKILVRQAATLTLKVEGLQSKVLAGEDIDLEQMTRLSNALSRALHRLGLRKRVSSKLTVTDNIRRAYPAARLGDGL
jgi:hypothetical protein